MQYQRFIKFPEIGERIEHTDICPTGVVFLMSFTLVGAKHQLRRFIAL